ncbi:general substrate transporter [Cylindrobasidium torrendii FP15055 ss-10]|uniref:General substrate transporter n=1 Tax=Cylindrobasidium torrendii FP15055 ss-10 TaxID=1314674 RepID=A0A0D7BQ23_9AGAR|nr:general substrate transporter [Cylindrobasidium torrendii FP15055 ss-10]
MRSTRFLWPATGSSYSLLLQAASISALGLYGWDAGIMGGILNTPQFEKHIVTSNTELLSFISSGIILGDIFGCAIIAPLSWSIGRRSSILLCCWVALVGIIIQTAAVSATMLIVGRVILGLGNGALSAAVPVFVHESSVTKNVGREDERTKKVMVNIGLSVAAISIVAWLGLGVYKSPYDQGWRILLASQAVFVIVPIVILHGALESPRWFYAKGRMDEGDESLERLLGKSISDPELQAQRKEMIAAIRLEEQESLQITFTSMFKRDTTETKITKRIWISWLMQMGKPFFGGNLITYYGKSIIATLHFSSDINAIVTAALNSMVTLGCIISYFTVQRFGRRQIILFGCFVQVSAMLIFTVLGTLPDHLTTQATRWAQIAMLFWFEAGSGLSWIWMVYLYAIEIVPTRYRGQAGGIGNVGVWTLAFVFVYSGPIAIKDVGVQFFALFVVGGSLVSIACFRWIKETKGLSLEEIDLLWATPEFREKNKDARIIEEMSVTQSNDESMKDEYDKSSA